MSLLSKLISFPHSKGQTDVTFSVRGDRELTIAPKGGDVILTRQDGSEYMRIADGDTLTLTDLTADTTITACV